MGLGINYVIRVSLITNSTTDVLECTNQQSRSIYKMYKCMLFFNSKFCQKKMLLMYYCLYQYLKLFISQQIQLCTIDMCRH
jgi:hypothetical protein